MGEDSELVIEIDSDGAEVLREVSRRFPPAIDSGEFAEITSEDRYSSASQATRPIPATTEHRHAEAASWLGGSDLLTALAEVAAGRPAKCGDVQLNPRHVAGRMLVDVELGGISRLAECTARAVLETVATIAEGANS